MTILKQPNCWSCGVTALAMLLDRPIDFLIDQIGHDGSGTVHPELPSPMCYKGFSIPELQDVAYRFGFPLMEISPIEMVVEYKGQVFGGPHPQDDVDPVIELFEKRLDYYLPRHSGLLIGSKSLAHQHMVAWDRYQIFDPCGDVYSLDDSGFQINQAFLSIY